MIAAYIGAVLAVLWAAFIAYVIYANRVCRNICDHSLGEDE
ncbi:hypothetical protein [Microtetraspora sp. AC03309]|nr:hypothetical protein [Microtetraspora sp. AC03309]